MPLRCKKDINFHFIFKYKVMHCHRDGFKRHLLCLSTRWRPSLTASLQTVSSSFLTTIKNATDTLYLSTLFICHRPSLKFPDRFSTTQFNPIYSTYGMEIVHFTIDDFFFYRGYSHLKEYTLDNSVIVPHLNSNCSVAIQCCSEPPSPQCFALGGNNRLPELLNI